jgi:UDP-N-acetylmuramoyl-tripeptide--D-alanyl-D-alanine ligase
MKAAIKSFAATKGEPKIAILGGMKEMGEESSALHSEVALLAKQLNFAKVIFVGNEFEHIDFGIKFSTTAEAQNWLAQNPIKSAHILVKGSRAYKLETLFAEQ